MLVSCSDWLSEEGAPKLNYDYYKTEEGVNAAVIATYSYLRWGCGGERYDVLTEQGTDLFIAGSDGNYKASFNMYGTQLNPDIDVHCCPEKFYHSVSCLGPSPSGTLAVRSV